MSQKLWTPFPPAAAVSPEHDSDRARVVRPEVRVWFREFAKFLTHHRLLMHCGLCRVDIKDASVGWQHWGECQGYRPPLDGAAGKTIVKSATGGLLWFGGAPTRVELKAEQIEWLRQFEDVGPHFLLGVHCQFCDADAAGNNQDSDSVFSAACRCREWVGPNRDHVLTVPPTSLVN